MLDIAFFWGVDEVFTGKRKHGRDTRLVPQVQSKLGVFIYIAGTTALPMTDPDQVLLRPSHGVLPRLTATAAALPGHVSGLICQCLCQADKVSVRSSKQSRNSRK